MSHSSVPSGNNGPATGASFKNMDRIAMYCSYFTYCDKAGLERNQIRDLNKDDIIGQMQKAESMGVKQGTSQKLGSWMFTSNAEQQRFIFDDSTTSSKSLASDIIRGLIDIVSKVNSNPNLQYICLVHLDGILEDSRIRIKSYVDIMNGFKDQLNIIQILDSFIRIGSVDQKCKDIASHILALCIEAQKFDKCAQQAKDFVVWLKSQTMQRMEISKPAFSFALMTILKKNELARDYCDVQGIQLIDKFLEGPCIDQQPYSPQVCYNIICSLWILSYHPFAQKYFEDYSLSLIEKATKVLDFYSWEKIARILLQLYMNVKDNAICQEHLADIDAFQLIIKLQNRHWVDEDINKLLKSLFEYFDENQREFSSVEKFRNQVQRKQLRWGPCHTEKFWQENVVAFDKQDNMHLMTTIAEQILMQTKDQRCQAVACFDLGEFCRFSPNGKIVLERCDVKTKMANLMRDPNVGAEVKKEAITCYQKLLMGSWSSNDFKHM